MLQTQQAQHTPQGGWMEANDLATHIIDHYVDPDEEDRIGFIHDIEEKILAFRSETAAKLAEVTRERDGLAIQCETHTQLARVREKGFAKVRQQRDELLATVGYLLGTTELNLDILEKETIREIEDAKELVARIEETMTGNGQLRGA